MISSILSVAQLVLAVFLVLVILLQQQGSGLGSAFGGSGGVHTTRRGVDRLLFRITIASSILFFAVAIAKLLVF